MTVTKCQCGKRVLRRTDRDGRVHLLDSRSVADPRLAPSDGLWAIVGGADLAVTCLVKMGPGDRIRGDLSATAHREHVCTKA